MSSEVTRVGQRGTIVIPAALRHAYKLDEARRNLNDGGQMRLKEFLAPLLIVPQPAITLPDNQHPHPFDHR